VVGEADTGGGAVVLDADGGVVWEVVNGGATEEVASGEVLEAEDLEDDLLVEADPLNEIVLLPDEDLFTDVEDGGLTDAVLVAEPAAVPL